MERRCEKACRAWVEKCDDGFFVTSLDAEPGIL